MGMEYEAQHIKNTRTSLTTIVLASAGTTLLTLLIVAAFLQAYTVPLLASRGAASGTPMGVVAPQLSGGGIPDIVAEANSAVVSVVVTKDLPVYERYYEEFNPFGDGPGGFVVPRVREKGTEEKEVGGGSGFFVTPDGLVVTNKHVVEDTEATYTVVTTSGEKLKAEVLARDPVLDIAVLRVTDGSDYPFLSFGDSDQLRLGEPVIAIGNALAEFRNSVSVGVVSGLARNISAGGLQRPPELLEGLIQTDAAINPGNSGGPLLNAAGEVVGVNVAVAGGAENIGFALPSNLIRRSVESVEKNGVIERAYLGVRYLTVTPELATAEDLPVTYGAWVRAGADGAPAVSPDGPARKAGLRGGDLIVALDEVSLEDRSLSSVIGTHAVGDRITVTYYRGGEQQTAEVVLEAFTDAE